MSKLLFNNTYLQAKDIAYIQSDGPGKCLVMTVRHEELHVDEGISKVPEYMKNGLYYMLSRYLYLNLNRIVRINSRDRIVTLAYDKNYSPLGKSVCISGDLHEDIKDLPEESLSKLRKEMKAAPIGKRCLETKAESLYFSLDDVLFVSTHKDYVDGARKSSTVVFMNLKQYTENNVLINKVDDLVNDVPDRSVDARFSHSFLVRMSAIDSVEPDRQLLILKDAWGEPVELKLPREALRKYADAIQPGHRAPYGFNAMTVDNTSCFNSHTIISDAGETFLEAECLEDDNEDKVLTYNNEDMLQKRKIEKEDVEYAELCAELEEIDRQLVELMNRKFDVMCSSLKKLDRI